jgi:hypothetical protein
MKAAHPDKRYVPGRLFFALAGQVVWQADLLASRARRFFFCDSLERQQADLPDHLLAGVEILASYSDRRQAVLTLFFDPISRRNLTRLGTKLLFRWAKQASVVSLSRGGNVSDRGLASMASGRFFSVSHFCLQMARFSPADGPFQGVPKQEMRTGRLGKLPSIGFQAGGRMGR